MTAPATTAVSRSLAEGVVAALRRAGEHRPVVTVEAAPFALASSWPAAVLSAHVRHGPPMRLFAKDLSTRRHDVDIDARRDREVAVHADLLPDLHLGTPRWYGTVTDADTGHRWLLLELVDGEPLRWQPLPVWLEAAAWLARLHARVAADPSLLTRCPQVQPVTAAVILRTAAVATDAAGTTDPALGRRVATVLGDHAELAARLAAAPRTLVHGGYRPQNILWCPTTTPPRVCPVDWEEAAQGPATLDLAFLVDGFDPPRRARFVETYRATTADLGLSIEDRGAFEGLLDACALHKTLGTLAKAVDRGFPPSAVARLVAMVETAVHRTRSRPLRVGVTPSPYAGRARADIVTVGLDDDTPTVVHVKHTAPFDGNPDKRRRDREQQVYERLLDRPGLPVAEHLGTVTLGDHTALVLAHVAGGDLRHHGLDVWQEAAAALGMLHAGLAGDPRLATTRALLRFDGPYLWSWAERAVAEVTTRRQDWADDLASSLQGFDDLVAPLDSCTPTLVHHDLAPKNVLADPTVTPPAIRIVDWELAGVGCGMLDLVHLCHGLTDAEAGPLHAAYRRAVVGTGVVPDDADAVARVVAACRLHRTLYRLAHLPALDAGPVTVDAWIRDVLRWRAVL